LKNSLTISTPFFNKEDGLNLYFKVIKKINIFFKKKKINLNFLFINDGSNDQTLQKLKYFKKKNKQFKILIYNHGVNQGYGKTLINSIKKSKSKFLITYDSDCTYDHRLIYKIYSKAIKESFDIINVSYKLYSIKNTISFSRSLLSFLSNLTYDLFFKEVRRYKITVYTCSFRIYNLAKIKKIKLYSHNFNCCAELLIKSMLKGLKIAEIPGKYTGRKYGHSKMKIFKNIISSILTIFKIKIETLKFS